MAKCWTDKSFKQRLLSDANATLQAEGVVIPAGVTVNVLKSTSVVINYILNQSLDKDPRKRFPDIASLRHLLAECSSEAASSTSTAQPLGFVQGADIASVETVIFSKDFE